VLRQKGIALAFGLALLTGACRVDVGDDDADGAGQTGGEQVQPMPPPPPPEPAMRLEVSLSARELYVYRNGQVAATHGVAVGSSEWPTRTGQWTIDEVVFNPRWVPPDEEWAKDEDEEEPGASTNPLGRAQLVYDRPRSIHGTNEPNSIGQAVSHGSIRVRNEVALQLAREVMEAAGVDRIDERIREAEQNRNREVTIRLDRGIPISVVESSAAGAGTAAPGTGTGATSGTGTAGAGQRPGTNPPR
jgi:hypothetical protein